MTKGIKLQSPASRRQDHGGARSKLYCPQCGGGREKERNFFVKIDGDGKGFDLICHHANNGGHTGGQRLKGAGPANDNNWTPQPEQVVYVSRASQEGHPSSERQRTKGRSAIASSLLASLHVRPCLGGRAAQAAPILATDSQ